MLEGMAAILRRIGTSAHRTPICVTPTFYGAKYRKHLRLRPDVGRAV